MENEIDLTREPGSRVQTAAFYQVRDLGPGEAVVLLTADEPSLMMTSLNLQLRETLAWTTDRAGGGYRTRVCLRDETEARDALDVLMRDHRHLDETLAIALRRVNAGDVAGARALLEPFAQALRRHVHVENEILAPLLPRPMAADGTSHVEIMLREHDEIERQVATVESCFADGAMPEVWEVEPFIAILSGTMAKHEYREETNLFPHWEAAVAAMSPADRASLMKRVQEAIAPDRDR